MSTPFHVTLDEIVAPVVYNYQVLDGTEYDGAGELPGTSAFLRQGDRIFHTYSTYARGVDLLMGTYNWLDLTARGRQEPREEPSGRSNSANWFRYHDKYDA